jgi:DNA-binding transcriptional MocR family regulator
MLHPSDIYVLCGLLSSADRSWTYRDLASELAVPHSVVQRALQRLEEADLYSRQDKSVHRANAEEFLIHGLRFLVQARLGGVVPGVPAAWAAAPMSRVVRESGDLPPVWPSARGSVRGQALRPLHEAAVTVVEKLPRLGELLAIVDSLRAGDIRVRSVAADMLGETIRGSLE